MVYAAINLQAEDTVPPTPSPLLLPLPQVDVEVEVEVVVGVSPQRVEGLLSGRRAVWSGLAALWRDIESERTSFALDCGRQQAR